MMLVLTRGNLLCPPQRLRGVRLRGRLFCFVFFTFPGGPREGMPQTLGNRRVPGRYPARGGTAPPGRGARNR